MSLSSAILFTLNLIFKPVWLAITLPYCSPTLTLPLYLCGLLSVGVYLLIVALQTFVVEKLPIDLKQKYKASWAVVTGASSGIGKAITAKLATQGINVVLVALGDDVLDKTFNEFTKQFPKLSFRKVGVNLGQQGSYMEEIKKATEDIPVSLLFNNAGYITTGFFAQTDLSRLENNMHCNADCVIPITHYFVNQMEQKKLSGLVAFTSSSAGFFPNPLSSLYPSTKAFLTFFATSIAPELKSRNIDVVVVHPSPMATNFFAGSGGMEVLEFARKFAVGPEVIADVVFNSAGRFVVRDQGAVTIIFRLLSKIVDFVFLAEMINRFGHTAGDFVKMDKRKK